jgi:CBS domain-containing protein
MKIATARDLMSTNVITATKDMSVKKVMELMLRWHISGLPVVDEDNRPIGVISEIDIVNLVVDGNALETVVEEAMSKDLLKFPPDAPMKELVQCFDQKRIRRLPIVEDGQLVGVVSRRDILREMLSDYNRF